MMKLLLTFALLVGVQAFAQDPCAGCDDALSQSYQRCASQYGNPCAELNAKGLVGGGPGQKKDISCCMKKEKHDRCTQCTTMDCEHGTCNVNKKYYRTYQKAEKLDTKKAMKGMGPLSAQGIRRAQGRLLSSKPPQHRAAAGLASLRGEAQQKASERASKQASKAKQSKAKQSKAKQASKRP